MRPPERNGVEGSERDGDLFRKAVDVWGFCFFGNRVLRAAYDEKVPSSKALKTNDESLNISIKQINTDDFVFFKRYLFVS